MASLRTHLYVVCLVIWLASPAAPKPAPTKAESHLGYPEHRGAWVTRRKIDHVLGKSPIEFVRVSLRPPGNNLLQNILLARLTEYEAVQRQSVLEFPIVLAISATNVEEHVSADDRIIHAVGVILRLVYPVWEQSVLESAIPVGLLRENPEDRTPEILASLRARGCQRKVPLNAPSYRQPIVAIDSALALFEINWVRW